eukprot:767157-Hanusia_phi.AAC.11
MAGCQKKQMPCPSPPLPPFLHLLFPPGLACRSSSFSSTQIRVNQHARNHSARLGCATGDFYIDYRGWGDIHTAMSSPQGNQRAAGPLARLSLRKP